MTSDGIFAALRSSSWPLPAREGCLLRCIEGFYYFILATFHFNGISSHFLQLRTRLFCLIILVRGEFVRNSVTYLSFCIEPLSLVHGRGPQLFPLE